MNMPVGSQRGSERSRLDALDSRSALSDAQREQLRTQLAAHRHERYEVDIPLPSLLLSRFAVHPNVMRPELMSSRWLAEYLAERAPIFAQKSVIDMGCGCGIQGLVTALKGAKKVSFSDVSAAAVRNTRENAERSGMLAKSEIFQADLFDKLSQPAEIVVFNHPFFADDPIPDIPVSAAMLDSGKLIQRFFAEAKRYCTERIVMPFFHLAGGTNDPGVQGPKSGWIIDKRTKLAANAGLQLGQFSIYELTPG